MWKRTLLAVMVLLLPLLVVVGNTGATPIHGKWPIGVRELIDLYQAGRPIVNREIPADAIIKLFKRAYEDAEKAGMVYKWTTRQEPEGSQDPPKLKQLEIQNSIIVGQLNVGHIRTPDSELREDVRQHLDKGELLHTKDTNRNATIIPIAIYVKDSTFEDYVNFQLAIFLRRLLLENVTFQSAVTFTGAYFEYGPFFERVTFGTEDRLATNVDFNRAYSDDRLECRKVTFKGNVSFTQAKSVYAEFDNTTFEGRADFQDASFIKDLTFEEVTFRDTAFFYRTALSEAGDPAEFRRVNFQAEANFSRAKASKGAIFSQIKFFKEAFFSDLNKDETNPTKWGTLEFYDVEFGGRTYFDNSRLDALWLSTVPMEVSSQDPKRRPSRLISPVTFEKSAVFSHLDCSIANLSEVEFHDFADFSHASFRQQVNLSNTSFKGEVNFNGAIFPSLSSVQESGLVLDGVRFQMPVRLTWEQIDGRVRTDDKETWSDLQETFKRSGNLQGQNEAMYHQRRQEGDKQAGVTWAKATNILDRGFWGYGVRPMRVIGWMILTYLVFTLLYWTRPKGIVADGEETKKQRQRLKLALRFSLLTSWKLGYGYQKARTTLFKVLTLIQSIGFKIMLLCLLNVFSNTSPLLNELVGKLLPR